MLKNPISAIKNIFATQFGDTKDVIIVSVPGRVNIIGEHTDYNDGFVMPMTIDRAIYFALRKRNALKSKVYSANFRETIEWVINDYNKISANHWSNYLKGVMKVLHDSDYKIGAFEAVIYGDIPIGAGLSSSAALEIAALYSLQQLFNLDIDPIAAIKMAQRAENEFVGMHCGIMDQFTLRLGKKDHALFLDCRTLDYENIPLKFNNYVLLIINSNIKHQLVDSAYNERRAQCETAVKHFQTIDPNIKALRDISLEMLEQYGKVLPEVIYRRARHVITENDRVLEAREKLKACDFVKLGELLYASHLSLKNDYEVSCKELDYIVETAKSHKALGARLTGAGFGGCAIALITKEDAPKLYNYLMQHYPRHFNLLPTIMQLEKNFEIVGVKSGHWT